MTYMQPYELDAWLGDTELTDEQRDAFARMVEAIADRYPGREHGQHPDEESITEAMTGALQVLLGDDTLEGLSAAWSRARAAEREAMERLTGAIIAEAQGGAPEVQIAERAGVARMTVRRALGKYNGYSLRQPCG